MACRSRRRSSKPSASGASTSPPSTTPSRSASTTNRGSGLAGTGARAPASISSCAPEAANRQAAAPFSVEHPEDRPGSLAVDRILRRPGLGRAGSGLRQGLGNEAAGASSPGAGARRAAGRGVGSGIGVGPGSGPGRLPGASDVAGVGGGDCRRVSCAPACDARASGNLDEVPNMAKALTMHMLKRSRAGMVAVLGLRPSAHFVPPPPPPPARPGVGRRWAASSRAPEAQPSGWFC